MRKYQIAVFLLCNVILIGGCSSKKELIPSINGYYRIHFYKSKSSDRTVIFGNIYEYKTNIPLPVSAVKINNYISYKADTTGKYKFSVKPDTYTFTGIGLPYRFAGTDLIKVNLGDSVKIDFYLKPDITPLSDSKIDY
jgi:hypothetical protein